MYISVFFLIFLHDLIWCALRAFSYLFGSCFFVQMSITPYVGFTDGVSCSTRNLSSIAWVIYNLAGELIDLQGICLGQSKNNVVEYSVVIELLTEAISFDIHALIVNLYS